MSTVKKKRARKGELLQQQETLRRARSFIAAALSELHSQNPTTSLQGDAAQTFLTFLQDAVFEIDSRPDLVDPYLDPAVGYELARNETSKSYSLGSLNVPRRESKLQRIRALKVALLGGRVTVIGEDGKVSTKTTEGILESLKYVTLSEESD